MWIYFLITGKLAQLGSGSFCGWLIYGTSKVPQNKLGQLPGSQLNFKLNLYSNRPQTADGCCWWCRGAIGGAMVLLVVLLNHSTGQ